MTQNTHIKFIDVSKSYGDNVIINKLNLDVYEGEFLTMLGPSGSGKTTCLMMLAGFENISSGQIYVNNKSIDKTAAHKRNIGMVFQHYALFPHMKVADNLSYPLKFRNLDKKTIKNRVDEFLELVQLQDFANRYPAQLSGGQQQRVALARALIYKPSLVLMDEPLGALDKNLREHMQYEIKRLHNILGFTTIYVTHDQTEALTMSDRIAVFNNGVIQQISDTKTIYNKPCNSFVANFIGENNYIFATLTKLLPNNKAVAKLKDNSTIITNINDNSLVDNGVKIFIRPENIRITKDISNIDSNDNYLKSNISDIIFVGDYIRVRVMVFNKFEFMVKNIGVSADNFKINDNIYLLFSQDNCLALV